MQKLHDIELEIKAAAEHRPVSVKAIVISSDRKILLLKRPCEKRWDIPGGGVDAGETLAEALVREMIEETALVIDNAQPLYTYLRAVENKPEKIIQYVLCRLDTLSKDISITLSHEHDSYEFFDYEEVMALQMVPSYIEALQRSRKIIQEY